MEELSLNKRVNRAVHSARAERRKGNVPGIIYGKKIGNLMFEIGALALEKELSIVGEHGVVNFDLDGKKGMAVIKEVQKDPVSQKVIHLDLEEVSDNAKMETEVPIKFIGKEFLGTKGLVLQAQKDLVRVSCTPENLPKFIEVDVSKANLGTVYSFGNLEVGKEISIVDDLSGVFAAVTEEQGNNIADSEEEES